MRERNQIDPFDTDGTLQKVKYYHSVKRGLGLQMLDRSFRTLTWRRTRKMVERCAGNAEYRLLEREALRLGATRVLDAGCGGGRVALTLGAGIRAPTWTGSRSLGPTCA